MGDGTDPSGPYIDEVNRIGRLLMAAWEKAEGPVNVSYVATFADMARAVVEDNREIVDGYKDALALSGVVSSRLIDSLTRKMNEEAEVEAAKRDAWDEGFTEGQKYGEYMEQVSGGGHFEDYIPWNPYNPND